MIPKFRIWDKTNKEMLEWEELDLNKERGEDEITIFEPTGQFAHPIFFYDAMQSTGLKDISGAEIYEGDIVKNVYDEIYLVKWLDAGFYLEERYNGGFDYFIMFDSTEYEVIGNVFEDKNLLSDLERGSDE